MRISDWSSDVCSSDLLTFARASALSRNSRAWARNSNVSMNCGSSRPGMRTNPLRSRSSAKAAIEPGRAGVSVSIIAAIVSRIGGARSPDLYRGEPQKLRSEEHTSELQSLMRISYAVFCLQKKQQKHDQNSRHTRQ